MPGVVNKMKNKKTYCLLLDCIDKSGDTSVFACAQKGAPKVSAIASPQQYNKYIVYNAFRIRTRKNTF